MKTNRLGHPALGTGTLQPIAKTSLAERLAAILTRFIVLENLRQGDRLPSERDLAATLGVSHRVVREALGILVGQGLIAKEHGRKAVVRAFDRELADARSVAPSLEFPNPGDLEEARCAIEIGMMRLVARHATEDDLDGLQRIVDAMKPKAERDISPAAEDLLFHQTLLRATHNETLGHFAHLISESMRHHVYDSPGILHRSIKEELPIIRAHQAIVDALRARDGAGATRAMADHLRVTLETAGAAANNPLTSDSTETPPGR